MQVDVDSKHALGIGDGGAVDAIVSGLSALAGIGWSIYDKRQPAA